MPLLQLPVQQSASETHDSPLAWQQMPPVHERELQQSALIPHGCRSGTQPQWPPWQEPLQQSGSPLQPASRVGLQQAETLLPVTPGQIRPAQQSLFWEQLLPPAKQQAPPTQLLLQQSALDWHPASGPRQQSPPLQGNPMQQSSAEVHSAPSPWP